MNITAARLWAAVNGAHAWTVMSVSRPPLPASRFPALPAHVLAAVDVQVGAGDPAGLFVDEERHGEGNLFRLAKAAGGDFSNDLGADFFRYLSLIHI